MSFSLLVLCSASDPHQPGSSFQSKLSLNKASKQMMVKMAITQFNSISKKKTKRSLLLAETGRFFKNWSVVDLRCCVHFCCTAKEFSYIYNLFHILFHYGLSEDTENSSLHYTIGRVCALSLFSRVWFGVALWIAVCQAPLSIVFCRQEYWSGLPFPSPGDLSDDPGIKPRSPAFPALADGFFATSATWEAQSFWVKSFHFVE